ncbi:VOC family protein [Psychrobacter sp. TAE2020]|uniref:VOC family protein n=1 Tax=Psychrobacter sp. TAE2020 TaxID=2846762 RepID=UPI001C11C883|nr:VOC family protein [Psychrobacter sp. TAE2020]MBU5616902.1 VOC family protein [Psychrobacter sp. TAE2020]
MQYLHAMIRTNKLEETLAFYCELMGLKLLRKKDSESGRFSLYFLATHEGAPEIEVTHNWDEEEYSNGNNFGHFAFRVDNVYEQCEIFRAAGVDILRPPRDGYMAFVKDPNNISIELLQSGERLAPSEPWLSMDNVGSW